MAGNTMADIMEGITVSIIMASIIPMSIIKQQRTKIKEKSEHHRNSCVSIYTNEERR
jgi:putative exporter of polyketide antibiotics